MWHENVIITVSHLACTSSMTARHFDLKEPASIKRRRKDAPHFVFAVSTFVSSSSRLESTRFADAELNKGISSAKPTNRGSRDLVTSCLL
jgi:hypothetical protein